MPTNRGKPFEQKFKEDFLSSIPGSTIDRLHDSVSGYKSISNVCDFIGYKKPHIFYLECKCHKGNTFPFTNLSQYDELIKKAGIEGVRAGVVLWMIEHDLVVYIPISSIKKMKEDGCKSFNVKMINNDEYRIVQIPSEKLRVYMKSDYSVLMNLEEGD